MIDERTPHRPSPLYGVARDDQTGNVVIDVTDAALARLIELLIRRPSLIAALADTAAPAPSRPQDRHRAITRLRDDHDLRAACAVRLDTADAVEFASAVIAAAAPPPPPVTARPRVGTRSDPETTNPRKDH